MNKDDIKLYNSMIPNEFYKVPYELFNTDCRYYTVLSKRASGKSTGILLWCLLDYVKNGNTMAYIRITSDEIKQSIAQDLFNVIIDNNYIDKITNGTWNTIYYKWRKIYLAYAENGEITCKSDKPFCSVLACSEHSKYKSTLNLPDCANILFDEFITINNNKQDFFRFFDLHSTIVRKRDNVKTFMCANTIDVNSLWFKNLLIEDVSKMKVGDKKLFVTEQGTKNYVEILGNNKKFNQITTKINRLYYGFNNTALNSITGEGQWAYDYYPFFDDEYTHKNVLYSINLKYYSYIFSIDFYESEKYGTCIYIHETDYIKEENYTLIAHDDNIVNTEYYKGFINKQLTNTIQLLKYQGRLFTDTPFTYKIFCDYCKEYSIRM